MKIVYLGSGDIGLRTLGALLGDGVASDHEVLAVVTQPDRPSGRHLTLAPGPIKTLAMDAGVPVLQPERIRKPEALEALRALGAEVFVVFAYGQILPPAVLGVPGVACLNLHASLLPRHRGAAPIQAAILAGDAESGLTVMYMDEGLDTGDILLEKHLPLSPRETGGSLHDSLAELAPGALFEALDALAAGTAPRRPQDASLATHAPKLDRQSGRIEWTKSPVSLDRLVRAMNPWPGAFTTFPVSGKPPLRLKIHEACPVDRERHATAARMLHGSLPGTVVPAENPDVFVAAGEDDALCVTVVQLEGGRRLSAADFFRGHPLPPGARLGD